MAILTSIVNWIVAFIFNHFIPTIKIAKKFPEAILPTRRQDGSLGYDLYAPETIEFEPWERRVIDTGIIVEFSSYLSMYLWDKSSVAFKKWLTVCGGVVDPGYVGSIGIILQNHRSTKVIVPKGSAIAQMVFSLAIRPATIEINETEISENTARGERGFGGDWEWHIPPKRRILNPNDP